VTALPCILRALARAAELQPGVPQWTPGLCRGLTIGLLLDNGRLTIELARGYRYPSEEEWDEVLTALPYAIKPAVLRPRRGIRAGDEAHVLWATTKVDVQARLIGIGPP